MTDPAPNESQRNQALRGDLGGGFRGRDDHGYVMALVALLIIPMTIFVAFAVDLGAWYAQGVRQQRAADMAAMAGVVWVPNEARAGIEATNSLRQNGFTSANATITMSAPTSTRYRVTVTAVAPRFFSRVLNLGTQTLTRSATAQFNKPIPLGSPTNRMGNNLVGYPNTCLNPADSCAGLQPQLWAAIQGPYTRFQDGDAYATKCSGDTRNKTTCDVVSNPNGAQNASYRREGYLWAIKTPSAGVVTVEIYDAAHNDNRRCDGTTINTTQSANWTGDSVQLNSNQPRCGTTGDGTGFMALEATLFNDDGSDLTTDYDDTRTAPAPGGSFQGVCSFGPGRLYIPRPNNDTDVNNQISLYKNRWTTICRFNAIAGGVYPLRIRTSAIPGVTDRGGGYNAYSLRASISSGTQPQVYGIGDMSIWNNASGSTARFYLAEVGPENAGKRIQLDLYDPGDGSAGTYYMQFRPPPSGAPNFVPSATSATTSCRYNSPPGFTTRGGGTLDQTSTNCRIMTRNGSLSSGQNLYNGRWLRVEIDIPVSYTCSTDCWWTVQYDFGSGGNPTDRTVWGVNVVGDPVRLVE